MKPAFIFRIIVVLAIFGVFYSCYVNLSYSQSEIKAPEELIKQADRLYGKGEYKEAGKLYDEAAELSENVSRAKLETVSARGEETVYRIAKGDTLTVKIYREDDLSGEYEVLEDGTISFPLLEKVHVEGLTKLEAERKIKRLLEKDYLSEAHVNITLEEVSSHRQVTIIGEVNNPGNYAFPEDRNLTLIEAISLAGGFTRYASIGGTRVIRTHKSGKKTALKADVKGILNAKKEDLILRPGDLIMIPERFF